MTTSPHPPPNRRLRVLAATVTLLVAGLTPSAVDAGKPQKSDGGSSTSSVQACSALGDSLTGADLRAAIGVPRRADGSGIDVAVIDTGITGVPSAIDGIDLSFDSVIPELYNHDLHGHGSHMAQAIAAVAPDARLVDVKVGSADGTVDVSQVIAAIDWVITNRRANGMDIRVISLAYDTDAHVDQLTDPLTHAVQNAWNHGIVVVVAGGNDGRSAGRLGNPALNSHVISVGAAERKTGKWDVPSWSSRGDEATRVPDFVAPGADVLVPAVAGSYLVAAHPAATCDKNGTLMIRGSGTSQAAAVTAAAAAILLEDRPQMSPNQVKHILVNSATPFIDSSGEAKNVEVAGAGLLNVGAAIVTATPSHTVASQGFNFTTGLGSLDASRGTYFVGTPGDLLEGDTVTAFGENWDQPKWAVTSAFGYAWTNNSWSGGSWSGGSWSGASWSGASWSGASWSGASWSGASWSGASWSGASWSGASWSGASWSGASWA
jgi:serine protease AprX